METKIDMPLLCHFMRLSRTAAARNLHRKPNAYAIYPASIQSDLTPLSSLLLPQINRLSQQQRHNCVVEDPRVSGVVLVAVCAPPSLFTPRLRPGPSRADAGRRPCCVLNLVRFDRDCLAVSTFMSPLIKSS